MGSRWGILGTGKMAARMAAVVAAIPGSEVAAVASRRRSRAAEFARLYAPGSRCHGSYDELLEDRQVDVVYVALPNSEHVPWATRALGAGKHVVCEKPLALNAGDAQGVVDAARTAGRYLVELYKYRFHPQTAEVVELLGGGLLGSCRSVDIRFSFNSDVADGRLFSPHLGGGALLDVGCYATSMLQYLVRHHWQRDVLSARLAGAGVMDGELPVFARAVADYGGFSAVLTCGIRCQLPEQVIVAGDQGYVVVDNPWRPGDAAGGMTLHSRYWPARRGRRWGRRGLLDRAVRSVEKDIREGRCWSDQMPWSDSLEAAWLLDAWTAAIAGDARPPVRLTEVGRRT
jgi:predicted dehydrogenase